MKGKLSLILAVLILAPSVNAASTRIDRLPTKVLAKEAKKVVRNGGIYSRRCGHASSYLKRISYELVERAFRPYGTEQWALYVVDRESCFNPGAVNTKYDSWINQAKGLAQLIPKYHRGVDYDRLLVDPAYAVRVFVRISQGGRATSPWKCGC